MALVSGQGAIVFPKQQINSNSEKHQIFDMRGNFLLFGQRTDHRLRYVAKELNSSHLEAIFLYR